MLVPQVFGLIFILFAGAHRYRKAVVQASTPLWREGLILLRKPAFLASCLAICHSFLFLIGVTRVAFPFLAVNHRGLNLEVVGIMVAVSRLTDTFGRFSGGWLCDRINSSRVILLGVALGIPMFFLQAYGSGFITLLIPLAVMTMGFGFTNVGATTFALQSASKTGKELSLGISRASTSVGQTLGPLLCGALIEGLGFDQGFQRNGADFARRFSDHMVWPKKQAGWSYSNRESRHVTWSVQGSTFKVQRLELQPESFCKNP